MGTEVEAYVLGHLLEGAYKPFALVCVQAGAERRLDTDSHLDGAGEHTPALLGQLDETDPAVGRVQAPAHEALRFQLVQKDHDAARRYLQAFSEGLL